jgi:phosphoadenosine phosphosulfate reductase
MYKVKWDKESNGILLTDKIDGKEEIVPPRPVFFEELELLGFNNYWKYPKTQSPLLWGIGRRYFYEGELVAEANGGNIFEEPDIVVTDVGKNLILKPIDVELIATKNKEALFTLENEAMDFVEHSYKTYKNKIDYFVVSFSGGKDSQVVLDIVSRIIPPNEYLVIFIDTTMELPCTYETVERTKKIHQKLYPNLRFYTAKHEEEAIELWGKFGPPSMILNWCRSVYKTSPFARFVKEMYKGNNQPKILVFEGVRSEESHTRESYNRISTSRQHIFQINAEVIKNWNISEVFLYLFSRNIEMNRAYRYGLNRVGCIICPFGSKWYEFIVNKMFPNLTNEYVHVITDYVKLSGIKDKKNIKLYIAEGQWKKRAGGRGIDTNGVRIDFIEKENSLEAVSMRPRENFLEWVKTVGDIIYKNQENRIVGEIKIGSEIFDFEMEKKNDDKAIVRVNNVGRDIIALNKLKKTLN